VYVCTHSKVSVVVFSPLDCLRINSRLIRFYSLIIGWLLLGLPLNCLGIYTIFKYTLKLHLGTLTLVLVLTISNRGLTLLSRRKINYSRYSEFNFNFKNFFSRLKLVALPPTTSIYFYAMLRHLSNGISTL
jgi:hypothetical protein